MITVFNIEISFICVVDEWRSVRENDETMVDFISNFWSEEVTYVHFSRSDIEHLNFKI